MDLHVPGELAALGTGVATHITLVRLLSGVRSDVDGQVGSVLENLPAVLAGVIPLDVLQGLQSALPGDLPHEAGLHGREGGGWGHSLTDEVLH